MHDLPRLKDLDYYLIILFENFWFFYLKMNELYIKLYINKYITT